jgi:hypothetical protein
MQARTPLLVPALVPLLLACAMQVAHADDTHDCVVASNEGQVLRDDHKLLQAEADFATCSREVCPAPVRKACVDWRQELALRVPTLVPAAHDATGRDLLQVRVLIDGKLAAETLDGKPIAVNPGPHVLLFEPSDGPAREENVIAREGERDRLISVELGPPLAASVVPAPQGPSEVRRPLLPAASWILGGVGVVALGSFAYFGLTGQSQKNDLQNSCASAQTCAPSDVSSMHTKLIVADVSLGVGIVALAISAYLALTQRPTSNIALGMQPSWQGSF